MAQQKNLARNKVNHSTQKYLDISEIKKDTVVMRDGSLRAVILVSSINFALKSEEEQNAIVSSSFDPISVMWSVPAVWNGLSGGVAVTGAWSSVIPPTGLRRE